jgi:ketopantoate reductase
MNMLCVGVGAVGGTVSARLAKSGIALTVCDAEPAHVALLRSPGLSISGLDDGTPVVLDAVLPNELSAAHIAATEARTGPSGALSASARLGSLRATSSSTPTAIS